jgi:hypothetical protein
MYMCYVKGSGVPHKLHKTKEAASAEAERLARAHNGKEVFILMPVEVFQAKAPPIEHMHIDEKYFSNTEDLA